ncbi:hypothetical protein JCM10212_001136 [Sporobolomyces blumeae]
MASQGSITPQRVHVPAPSTARGVSTKLYATPDGKAIAYGSGRSAVIRSLERSAGGSAPPPPRIFTHPHPVTVVKPLSAYYCASGDQGGNVKVWDTTGNYSVKLEAKPLARINDIAVDGEGKRFVVVGEGRSGWAASFNLDTGSSVGEISGHSKPVNAVAIRPSRPFKAVTGSDDFSTCFLPGVPFKYQSTLRRHTRFVQSLDYAPDGSLFVSSGSDGQVFLYDGVSGEEKGALVDPDVSSAPNQAHEKGVFAASFSRDSKYIATSSADKSVKLWDVATGKVVCKWVFEGDDTLQQQVGNVFVGDDLVSLSLSGDLNVLDPGSSTPKYVVQGHQNPLTALAVSPDGHFVTGDSAGRVMTTDAQSGEARLVRGNGHSGLVVDLVRTGDSFVSTSFDDTVKSLTTSSFENASLPTGTQPKVLAVSPRSGTIYLLTSSSLEVLSPTLEKLASVALSSSPLSLAVSPAADLVAVGTETSTVEVYDVSNVKAPSVKTTISLRSAVTALSFSPSPDSPHHLAIGLSTGSIPLYSANDGSLVSSRWAGNARIQALRWNDKGTHVAAASLDESLAIYSVAKPGTAVKALNVHRGGVKSLEWLGESQLVSAGADGMIRISDVTL